MALSTSQSSGSANSEPTFPFSLYPVHNKPSAQLDVYHRYHLLNQKLLHYQLPATARELPRRARLEASAPSQPSSSAGLQWHHLFQSLDAFQLTATSSWTYQKPVTPPAYTSTWQQNSTVSSSLDTQTRPKTWQSISFIPQQALTLSALSETPSIAA